MPERRKKPATYDDIVNLPEHLVGEILEGELVVSPRPAVPHARAASRIGADVDIFDRESGSPSGWWFLDEPELHLRGDVIVPDLAGWRRERAPTPPRSAAIELAPDWVCEVLSDRTARYDRNAKMRIYAREGVGFLWIVDPILRTLEVFAKPARRWEHVDTYAGAARVRPVPFDEVEIDLSRWWLPEPKPEPTP